MLGKILSSTQLDFYHKKTGKILSTLNIPHLASTPTNLLNVLKFTKIFNSKDQNMEASADAMFGRSIRQKHTGSMQRQKVCTVPYMS